MRKSVEYYSYKVRQNQADMKRYKSVDERSYLLAYKRCYYHKSRLEELKRAKTKQLTIFDGNAGLIKKMIKKIHNEIKSFKIKKFR